MPAPNAGQVPPPPQLTTARAAGAQAASAAVGPLGMVAGANAVANWPPGVVLPPMPPGVTQAHVTALGQAVGLATAAQAGSIIGAAFGGAAKKL